MIVMNKRRERASNKDSTEQLSRSISEHDKRAAEQIPPRAEAQHQRAQPSHHLLGHPSDPNSLLREREASRSRATHRLQHDQRRARALHPAPETGRLPLQQRHVQVHRRLVVHRARRHGLLHDAQDHPKEPASRHHQAIARHHHHCCPARSAWRSHRWSHLRSESTRTFQDLLHIAAYYQYLRHY